MSKYKYLRVTIHDNDFSEPLRLVGDILHEIFYSEDNYPTEQHLPILKERIKYLWHSIYMTQDSMRICSAGPVDASYFEPHLEFVDSTDIPDWDNGESIYIPMFDNGNILSR